MKDLVVIVPAYKPWERLDRNEQAALEQTRKVLGNRDLFLIYPQGLDVSGYGMNSFTFPKEYFTYAGYSKLLMSSFFYKDFSKSYKYLAIVQQDVWVFEDRFDYFLSEFDDKGYDYIGAPWYGVWFCKDGDVGNGGFCIRRVSKFQEICERYPNGGCNEDIFFCRIHKEDLNMAPESLALEFSFEEKPLHAYRLNHEKLPMGTHAYAKSPDRLGFWKQHIDKIYEDRCKAGNPDIYNPV